MRPLTSLSTLFKCTIRSPEPKDFERMANLAEQLGYPCTANQIGERLAGIDKSKDYVVFVAQLPGGQIAGWIAAYIFRAVELDICAEISGLIVDEQVRSRGIGKALLEAVEKWARSYGCNAISVHSKNERVRAHVFYIRNGYQYIKSQKYFQKMLAQLS